MEQTNVTIRSLNLINLVSDQPSLISTSNTGTALSKQITVPTDFVLLTEVLVTD